MPLAKIDHFSGILEERVYQLSDRRGTSDLVPFILSSKRPLAPFVGNKCEGVVRNGYSNGQAKSTMFEIISVVWNHCSCDENNIRLNVYVKNCIYSLCIKQRLCVYDQALTKMCSLL